MPSGTGFLNSLKQCCSSSIGVIAEGDKKQAGGSCEWADLLSLQGDGEFVDIMIRCKEKKDYTEIDKAISNKIGPYLYNGGEGKLVPQSDIRCIRQWARDGEGDMPSFSQNGKVAGAMADLEAAGNGTTSTSNMRFVCWKITKRGPVGETLLHLCVLLASSLTLDLAKRILDIFPKLLVDIYLYDQYYGENILHIAIVNEDPAMVRYLLAKHKEFEKDAKICVMERAFGVFFSCDDQLESRTDRLDGETLDMTVDTNYKGNVYWGEYPLSFAACLSQEECVRLLICKGADPRAKDHNGNTVFHMLVIHNNLEMFDLVLSLSDPDCEDLPHPLSITNNNGLTPLTLAAAMGHREMYDHLIEMEREVYWVYGDVMCAAYPLDNIDTIGKGGALNPASALHLIIRGDKNTHLDMVDGLVVELLKEKWITLLRFRFYRSFLLFFLYFVVLVVALLLRPGTGDTKDAEPAMDINNSTNLTSPIAVSSDIRSKCYLIVLPTDESDLRNYYTRLVFEALTVIGVIIFLVLAARNLYYNGRKRFFDMLYFAPSLICFYLSCFCILLMIPGRAFCQFSEQLHVYEDVLAIFAILLTAPYFLFFCRGLKMVGPFVIMIYKMLVGDLLRFFIIYLIFLVGFSQAMYVVHINYTGSTRTPFTSRGEAIMGMFYMSMGEFGTMYEAMNDTSHELIGKLIFLIYMILVTILLINMLIAMMGNTYTLVNETQKEWLRQWAQIVLTVEQTVTPATRLKHQLKYSQVMNDNTKRGLPIRWHQTDKEKNDLKKKGEKLRQEQSEIIQKYTGDHLHINNRS